MNDSEPFIARLRQLIGRDCRYYGRPCRIVEILSAEGRIVLEGREAMPPIQIDQYGQAAFRGNEHIEVPMFNQNSEFSEDLQHLLDGLSAGRNG
ncbi:MAG: hypothetical protein K9L70_12470 [Thiohalocapsa sp.]|jgi:hypothetical protein|nr:hypothetical protein [Thiohalocapsa sp.]MCF7992257.1 hypothetical protein [Thiohalocapsa sp.]